MLLSHDESHSVAIFDATLTYPYRAALGRHMAAAAKKSRRSCRMLRDALRTRKPAPVLACYKLRVLPLDRVRTRGEAPIECKIRSPKKIPSNTRIYIHSSGCVLEDRKTLIDSSDSSSMCSIMT